MCTVLCKLSHVQSEDSTIRKCGLERAMKSRKVLRTKLESVWRSGTCLLQSESFPSPRPTRPSPGRPFCRTETPTSFGSRLLLYPADSAVPAGIFFILASIFIWSLENTSKAKILSTPSLENTCQLYCQSSSPPSSRGSPSVSRNSVTFACKRELVEPFDDLSLILIALVSHLCTELDHVLCGSRQQGLDQPPHCVHHPGHLQHDDPADQVGVVVDQHL